MTWTVVNGVRVWNHITFPEPSDAELEACGWDKPDEVEQVKPGREPHYTRRCADCPELIRNTANRCAECFALTRHVVDELAVERVLSGQYKAKTNFAERQVVCRRWAEAGRSLNTLATLTGWRTARYVKVADLNLAA